MLPPLPPDPYKALGVDKKTQPPDIKKAHRNLVLKCHPDKIKTDDPKEKAKKVAEFQAIQQAYELLMDEDKRRDYDDLVEKHRRHAQAPPSMANMGVPRGHSHPVYAMHIPSAATRTHAFASPPRGPVFVDKGPLHGADFVYVDNAGIRRDKKSSTSRKKAYEEWDKERDHKDRERGSSGHRKKRDEKDRDRRHEEKKHRQRTPEYEEVYDESYKSSSRRHEERPRDRGDRERDRSSRRDRTPPVVDASNKYQEAQDYLSRKGSKVPDLSGPKPMQSKPQAAPKFPPHLGASPPAVPTPPPPRENIRPPPREHNRRPSAPPAPEVEEVDDEDILRSRAVPRRNSGMGARSSTERLGHKKSYSGGRDEPVFSSSPRPRPSFTHSPSMPMPEVPDSPANRRGSHPGIRRSATYHPEVFYSEPQVYPTMRRTETMPIHTDDRGRHRSRYAEYVVDEEEDQKAARRSARKEKSSHRSSRREPSPNAIFDQPEVVYRPKPSRRGSSSRTCYEIPPDHISGVRIVPSIPEGYGFPKVKVRRQFVETDVNYCPNWEGVRTH